MIIRNDFMKNNDGNEKPVIPGISSPFEYIQQQGKIRKAQQQLANGQKPGASTKDLHALEQQNAINRLNHMNQPFGKK